MTSIADLERRLAPGPRMPVLFVGHGNPMHAISDNEFTRAWAAVGADLPAAQAIVVISAHWLTPGSTRVLDAPRNRVIHDFSGFPPPLHQVRYESIGDHEVADILARQLIDYEAALDTQWGLDHGTWAVLVHMVPEPTVPILQISIDYSRPLPELYDLFGRLRALRDRGVVFIGSGNIVHSLGRLRMNVANPYGLGAEPWGWAVEFDRVTAEAIAGRDVRRLLDPTGAWGLAAQLSVPTDDHYRPMVAALSLLHEHEDIGWFNTAIDAGSIGMRSFISS